MRGVLRGVGVAVPILSTKWNCTCAAQLFQDQQMSPESLQNIFILMHYYIFRIGFFMSSCDPFYNFTSWSVKLLIGSFHLFEPDHTNNPYSLTQESYEEFIGNWIYLLPRSCKFIQVNNVRGECYCVSFKPDPVLYQYRSGSLPPSVSYCFH